MRIFYVIFPFFTDYPFGVFIVSKRSIGSKMIDFTEREKDNFAAILRDSYWYI